MVKKSLYLAVQDALSKGYKATPEGLVYGPSGRRIGTDQGTGYITIGFKDSEGNHHGPYAHRFIWMVFNGDIPSGYDVNHINHVKSDNRLENLECISHAENMRHTATMGLGGGGRGAIRRLSVAKLEREIDRRDDIVIKLWKALTKSVAEKGLSEKDFQAISADLERFVKGEVDMK